LQKEFLEWKEEERLATAALWEALAALSSPPTANELDGLPVVETETPEEAPAEEVTAVELPPKRTEAKAENRHWAARLLGV
jgi:hypothetical protein